MKFTAWAQKTLPDITVCGCNSNLRWANIHEMVTHLICWIVNQILVFQLLYFVFIDILHCVPTVLEMGSHYHISAWT